MRARALALAAAVAATALGPRPPAAADDAAAELTGALRSNFDSWLADTAAYRERVERECRQFPEGDLFPYLFPAFAYTNLAAAQPSFREEARARVATLISLALPAVVRKVQPPEGKLEMLGSYRRHATYLCQLNVALGAYRYLGGDDRFDAIHRRLTLLLVDALRKARTSHLQSFPELLWPFDTVPCLFSLHLADRAFRTADAPSQTARHLEWMDAHGLHPDTSLPWSQLDPKTGKGREIPRGCDLSWRLMLLYQFTPEAAARLYRKYSDAFWLERFVAAGFAEWPRGDDGPADADSGPIFLGIGSAASALGVGAARAAGDEYRFGRLVAQAAAARTALHDMAGRAAPGRPAMLRGMIPLSPEYVTGFLFGDAVLFYSLTWHKWE